MARHTAERAWSVPRATYRLQLNCEFGLRQATALLPYLQDLGISHVYASPILKAVPGSPHGYDVCDPRRLNPELGSDADFATFLRALRRRHLGLVLDIVPNHMGIGPENPWWWDVLKHGRASPYAPYFDIQWSSPDPRLRRKVLLPVLGDRYERVLARGELRVEARNDSFVLRYHDQVFPLHPRSLPALSRAARSSPAARARQVVLRRFRAHPALDALVRRQHYCLAFWRRGDTELNYRRFFTITSLAGLRVENPAVFADTHQLLRRWIERGAVQGLRVDHPDGLRDPEGYLRRLRALAPKAWIIVEKILVPGEGLPRSWPVAGTTGYDFLQRVGGLFIDPAAEPALTAFYARFTGEPADYRVVVRDAKRRVTGQLFSTETDRLTRLLLRIVHRQRRAADYSRKELRDAVVEMVAAFPVYRTYLRSAVVTPGSADDAHLRAAAQAAVAHRPELKDVIELMADVLGGRVRGGLEHEYAMRFQQLTGPAMAKGAEDTAFYRYHRLVALNEVGGDPGQFGGSLKDFHRATRAAHASHPDAMLATSTHDTKRSEDVRARLSVLSERPGEWMRAVRRWSAANAKHREHGWPDRNAEYLFYQTVVGAWPLSVERALACALKSAREARQHTSWTRPDAAYEGALRRFVERVLADPAFRRDLERFVQPLILPGQVNSLAQTLIKLTCPGVPDLYQGTELWDLSLVDPDNRRPVDFPLRRRLLAELDTLTLEAIWARRDEGLPKLWLIRQALRLRQSQPAWFDAGSPYAPLRARGAGADHVIAYARTGAVTIAPRLTRSLGNRWRNTTLTLPGIEWKNELTGEPVRGPVVGLGKLLRKFPVALLSRTSAPHRRGTG